MNNLKSGTQVHGFLVVTTVTACHIFKPALAKGAQKAFTSARCQSANVVRMQDRGSALVGLFSDGYARALSLPGLKEIGQARIDLMLDIGRLADAVITSTGDVLGWTSPSEVALVNVWGSGQPLPQSRDRLINPEAMKTVPPRPTISNLQWISGTMHITPSDMDALIGGPDRPPSKRMLAEETSSANTTSQPLHQTTSQQPQQPQEDSEGYWAYMQRQMQERTEQLGLAGDSVDRLGENSSNWAGDVGKYVKKQKRSMVLGAMGSKLGL